MTFRTKSKRRILAAGWHPEAINAISPVIRKLKGEGHDVILASYETGEKMFERHNLKHDIIVGNEFNPVIAVELINSVDPNVLLTGLLTADHLHFHK